MVNESDINDTVLIGIADQERYTKKIAKCVHTADKMKPCDNMCTVGETALSKIAKGKLKLVQMVDNTRPKAKPRQM